MDNCIGQLLKANGFIKTSRGWNRITDKVVNVITYQVGKMTPPKNPEFTINIGICLKDIHRRVWPELSIKSYTEADCVIRLRYGYFIDENRSKNIRDKWYHVDEGNEGIVREEISSLTRKKVLPFFDETNNFQRVFEFCQMNEWVYNFDNSAKVQFAILALELGHKTAFETIVQNLRDHKRTEAWLKKLESVTSQFN